MPAHLSLYYCRPYKKQALFDQHHPLSLSLSLAVFFIIHHDLTNTTTTNSKYYRKALVAKVYTVGDDRQSSAGNSWEITFRRTTDNTSSTVVEVARNTSELVVDVPSEGNDLTIHVDGQDVHLGNGTINDGLPSQEAVPGGSSSEAIVEQQSIAAAHADDGTDQTTNKEVVMETLPSVNPVPDVPNEIVNIPEQQAKVVLTEEEAIHLDRVKHLEDISDGILSVDEGIDESESLHDAWWTDIIREDGDHHLVRPDYGPAPVSADVRAASRSEGSTSPTGLSSHTEQQKEQESEQEEEEGTTSECTVAVLDAAAVFGPMMAAPYCNLSDPHVWPFVLPGHHGIDGASSEKGLPAIEYQYSQEYWLSESIKRSKRFSTDIFLADVVFLDMHCYHIAWLSFMHPYGGLGLLGSSNPTPYIERVLQMVLDIPRFKKTKGGDFAMVRPSPQIKGLFREEALCDELASVFSIVPEHASLCVWTPEAPAEGKALIVPYTAVSDIMPVEDGAPRNVLVTFQGGCGNRDVLVRDSFFAGKMMRLAVVEEILRWSTSKAIPVHAHCACDICDGSLPHDELMALYRRSTFCLIMPSNTQSSRRLSEVILSGCIPVFIGAPFHTLPLAQDIDWGSAAVFLQVAQTDAWINATSGNWRHNNLINMAWKLDAPIGNSIIAVETIEAGLDYLQSGISAENVASKQQELKKIESLFDYRLPEDRSPSRLGELVVDKLCLKASRLKKTEREKEEAGFKSVESQKVHLNTLL